MRGCGLWRLAAAVGVVERAAEVGGERSADETKDDFEEDAGEIGEPSLKEKVGQGNATKEGEGLEDETVGDVGDGGGKQGALLEAGAGVGFLAAGADFGENAVVDDLADKEAGNAGEEDATGGALDDFKGAVVDAGKVGKNDLSKEENGGGEDGEKRAVEGDVVGDFLAEDFDEKVANDVGDREEPDAAVDRDAEEVPDLEGGEVASEERDAESNTKKRQDFDGGEGKFGGIGLFRADPEKITNRFHF